LKNNLFLDFLDLILFGLFLESGKKD